jgi:hypothetical protein
MSSCWVPSNWLPVRRAECDPRPPSLVYGIHRKSIYSNIRVPRPAASDIMAGYAHSFN